MNVLQRAWAFQAEEELNSSRCSGRSYSCSTLTWCSEGQAVIQATGFGGDEEVAEDTYSDEEGKQDHRCNGQTNQSTDAESRGERMRIHHM